MSSAYQRDGAASFRWQAAPDTFNRPVLSRVPARRSSYWTKREQRTGECRSISLAAALSWAVSDADRGVTLGVRWLVGYLARCRTDWRPLCTPSLSEAWRGFGFGPGSITAMRIRSSVFAARLGIRHPHVMLGRMTGRTVSARGR